MRDSCGFQRAREFGAYAGWIGAPRAVDLASSAILMYVEQRARNVQGSGPRRLYRRGLVAPGGM